jgi:hypothetical protein
MACAMLKGSGAMDRWVRIGLVVASVTTLSIGSRVAHAQTTAPTATATTPATSCVASIGGQPTVSVSSQQIVPNRFVNGVPLGTSTRPAALNPNGVNFSDCIQNMVLQFPVTACNFNGQNLQVWASRNGSDCTAQTDRGLGGVAVCWPVSQGSTGLVLSQGGENYSIRVQDIVGPQNDSPSPTTFTSQGASACTVQASYLAVPININFIPINPGDGSAAGPAYEYTLSTDLVGPPAPAGVGIADGDTLFVVNWTPNVDTDTGGYDVIIDPIPGQEPADGATSTGATGATTELVCPADSGMSTDAETDGAEVDAAGDGEATDAALLDATVLDATVLDATVAASDAAAKDGGPPVTSALDDAGCYTKTIAGSGSTTSGNGGMCNDPLLSGGTLADGGTEAAAIEAPEEFDDAGNLIVDDAATATATGVGGIFNPPAGHVLNPDPTLGMTATGETNSTHTITGLKNGVPYTVVVSSVDNFGNIGPPSTQACDSPAPVNDFWKIYRTDGGQAGGGFCALEAVGAPAGSAAAFAGAGALVLAGLRRRRSKSRR